MLTGRAFYFWLFSHVRPLGKPPFKFWVIGNFFKIIDENRLCFDLKYEMLYIGNTSSWSIMKEPRPDRQVRKPKNEKS
jgi:hypothetical protein